MGLHIEPERRKWLRRETDTLVRLTFPTHGIRDVSTAKFPLRNLSEGGATIYVGTITSLPDFFYLQFGDENSTLIGCYVVARDPDVIHCKFSTEIQSELVDRVVTLGAMSLMLDTLFEES